MQWHDAEYGYQIQSSVPSGWHDAINEAADSWDYSTDYMTLEEDSHAPNYIFKDEIEEGGGCTSESAACTVAC